jgi:hypothetical protein
MRRSRTMSPMTIVVVRDEPAGSSGVAASVFAADAGFAASAMAGAAVEAEVVDTAGAGAAAASVGFGVVPELAVDCENAAGETRARARRRAEIAERRFITRETIGRTGMRQAACRAVLT